MKKSIVLFCCLLFGNNLLGQFVHCELVADSTVSNSERLFRDAILTKIGVPRSVSSTCRSTETVAYLTFADKKISAIDFPIDCPEDLRKAFIRNIPFFQDWVWEETVPATRNVDQFKILIPYVYSMEAWGCADKISDRDHSALVKRAKAKAGNDAAAVFELRPIVIRITGK